ncbi:MAG: hypothetical protein QOG85_960 [Gaiellaceae bacterium]|jgi:hypothetical protein|nr:hypothetical protein [Gaiellaceae bacterium]
MRSYGMYDFTRGTTLALVAGVAGFGLWGAAQVGTSTPGRFWIAMAIVAGAGFLLALATHVGTWTKGLQLRMSPTTFLVAFIPVLVCVGWILLASQPGNGWGEGQIHSWSTSLGILGIVNAVGVWTGVLAFGFGTMLALSFDGVPAPEETDAVVTDEPVAAERRWTMRRRREDAVPVTDTTTTDTPIEEPATRT